ncbi:MAG: hypothetical protein ACTIM4_14665 [Marinomonas sp.]
MPNQHFDLQSLSEMTSRYRTQLINSLSGFKSANLIGTCNAQGQTNLAIFSSVFHLGASPALKKQLTEGKKHQISALLGQ